MVNTLPYLSVIPAYVLIGCAILFFFIGKAIPGVNKLPKSAIFIVVLAVALLIETLSVGEKAIFFDMIFIDAYSRLFNQIYFVVLVVVVLMMANNDEMKRENFWETYGLLSVICLGMMLMTSANHLLITAIGIEMVSIPSYILVAMNRKLPVSKEASLKYILFGSFAAGIMLYGMSLIFGLTGALRFEAIWEGLETYSATSSPIYYLALFMTIAGMMFKVAAVPFHFWCPDAYQAAPTPVTAFLSTAPKAAGLALIARFFSYHLEPQSAQLTAIISVIAIITMTLGNLAALRQTDIKRLLAYSSISHAGFMLMGIAVMSEMGQKVIFFYIIIYAIMNLGAFMAVIYLSKGDRFTISSLAGMIKIKPLVVVGFTICLFSLAGIPPFAGFIGKFYLFKIVIEKGLYLLAVVAGLNSVVALFYYVNIIKTMIIDDEETTIAAFDSNGFPVVFVVLCAIPIVIFGIYWVPVWNLAEKLTMLL